MPQLKISCHRKKYPNYHYFGRLLSRLTHAVLGEIFGWKYWLPQSKIFYPTLGGGRVTWLLCLTSTLVTQSCFKLSLVELGLGFDNKLRNLKVAKEGCRNGSLDDDGGESGCNVGQGDDWAEFDGW